MYTYVIYTCSGRRILGFIGGKASAGDVLEDCMTAQRGLHCVPHLGLLQIAAEGVILRTSRLDEALHSEWHTYRFAVPRSWSFPRSVGTIAKSKQFGGQLLLAERLSVALLLPSALLFSIWPPGQEELENHPRLVSKGISGRSEAPVLSGENHWWFVLPGAATRESFGC